MVNLFFRYETCSIYEIYPQSETSQLTEIAQLDYDIDEDSPSILIGQLSPTTVIWYSFYEDRIVFRVWDYRQNHSVNFSVDIQIDKYEFDFEVYFIPFKALKLASNSFVGRYWGRISLSSSYAKKQYLSGPFHLYYLNR